MIIVKWENNFKIVRQLSIRSIAWLVVMCVLIINLSGCANNEKKSISMDKIHTSYEEWFNAVGLDTNGAFFVQSYEESDNVLDIGIRMTDNTFDGYQDVLLLIERHNSFVKDNPEYFSDYVQIKIDVARGGAPVPEVSFLTNYGTLSDSALIGEKNNALFSYVEYYSASSAELAESGISIDFPNVIIRQSGANGCNSEESYSSLKLSSECTNVIVFVEGNDDLEEGSEYIHNIAPNAKVFLSRYGKGLEQKNNL